MTILLCILLSAGVSGVVAFAVAYAVSRKGLDIADKHWQSGLKELKDLAADMRLIFSNHR